MQELLANIDGATRGATNLAGSGGLFRDHKTTFLGAFALHLGQQSALTAELSACIKAVNIAVDKGWFNL